MHDLQRLRYVTERYAHLQGLRLVPLGIPFLLSSFWRAGQLAWVPGTEGKGASVWFLALLALAIGLSYIAKTYYERRFGVVRSALNPIAALAATVFAGLLIVAISLQGDSVIPVPALIVALGLGYVGVAGGQLRPHYLVVAGLVTLFSTLKTLGMPFEVRNVLSDQLIAIGFIIIGVGDHLVLRRTLQPVGHVEAV